MRIASATAIAILCTVPLAVCADELDPAKWELLPEEDAKRLVEHPDGRHWFIPASAPGTVLAPATLEHPCACLTNYFTQLVFRLTACSLPDQFDVLQRDTREATLGLAESLTYSRTFLTTRDAAVPAELYCVSHYGPWPADLTAESTCASVIPTFTLLPWSPLIPSATWSGLFDNHPVEIMFAQAPVEYGPSHCVPCGEHSKCGLPSMPGHP